jgi:hypothetical protein
MSADDLLPITVSVPVFGAVVYGVAKNLAYDMAKRGEIDVIDIGPKLKRVPVRPNLHRLARGDPNVLEALSRDFIAKLKNFRETKTNRAVA